VVAEGERLQNKLGLAQRLMAALGSEQVRSLPKNTPQHVLYSLFNCYTACISIVRALPGRRMAALGSEQVRSQPKHVIQPVQLLYTPCATIVQPYNYCSLTVQLLYTHVYTPSDEHRASLEVIQPVQLLYAPFPVGSC
jgi:hypothetical protein